jgi:CheY-like chemotaxis protein
VLLDLQTPQGDGRHALRHIRANARLRSIPLVILSTSDNPRDVEDCLALGANAYHTKSVSYPMHLNTVRAIFHYWLQSTTMPLHVS